MDGPDRTRTRRIGVGRRKKIRNYTDWRPSETNEDGKWTLNLRVDYGSGTTDNLKKEILKRRRLQEKSQRDFDEKVSLLTEPANRKNVGTEPAYREPASELLASSWDLIDSGLRHCGTVDKDDVRLTRHWHLWRPRKLWAGYRNRSSLTDMLDGVK